MNCPFCGANANRYTPKFARARFYCGTVLWDGREAAETDRTIACFRTEGDKLNARITALEDYANSLEVIGDDMKQAARTCDAVKWDAQRARRPQP